jgi:SAM-dependent methyltransferase
MALKPTYQRRDLARLQTVLFDSIDVSRLKGLELGPFDKPLVPRCLGEVRYLDFVDEGVLRKRCERNPNRNANKVVKLDYVLGDRSISETVTERFDYIVASHVIEHVPNMLGWLRELNRLLNPDTGYLFLVVPDRRFTFDNERPATSLGELIENDEIDRKRPALRAVFDQRYYHKPIQAGEMWRDPSHVHSLPRTFGIDQALELMTRAKSHYIDCHCNVFVDEGFGNLVEETERIGRQPFQVTTLIPTERPYLDFIAILQTNTSMV